MTVSSITLPLCKECGDSPSTITSLASIKLHYCDCEDCIYYSSYYTREQWIKEHSSAPDEQEDPEEYYSQLEVMAISFANSLLQRNAKIEPEVVAYLAMETARSLILLLDKENEGG